MLFTNLLPGSLVITKEKTKYCNWSAEKNNAIKVTNRSGYEPVDLVDSSSILPKSSPSLI